MRFNQALAVPLDEVEPVDNIRTGSRRQDAFGSVLSPEAHECPRDARTPLAGKSNLIRRGRGDPTRYGTVATAHQGVLRAVWRDSGISGERGGTGDQMRKGQSL